MKCFKPLNRAFQAATTTYPMHSHSLRSTCYLQALKRPQKRISSSKGVSSILNEQKPANLARTTNPVNRDVSRPVDPMAGVHGLQHLRSAKGWTRKRKKALLRTAPYEMRKYENVFSEIRKPHQKVCF
ncbi:hypothetical protein N7491_001810 [Penicillium cf. griseofulvum]|nr:hypothetical protein N7491_001810 [Penicillium cf. griseofulvum]